MKRTLIALGAILVIAAASPVYVGKTRFVHDISTNSLPLAGVTNAGTAAGKSGVVFANITVVTNGTDTMTLNFTNGVLMSVAAP